MKKLLLYLLFLCSSLFATAAVRTWTGGSGNWNNALNWTPNFVPVAGDDVIFNTSATVTIDLGISPISLNSLHIINSSTVIFQCGETSNFRLFSTSVANPALLIEAGSTFTFDATNVVGTNNSTLDLTVAAGCIGSISGTLNISCTGAVTNGPKLDTYNSATNYGIVTVTNGGKIRILPNADNTVSSISPVSTLIMQDGSVYENLKNGGSFPKGTWAPTSMAKALGTGTIGPIFNGTSYGNLEWNLPAQNTGAFLSTSVSFNNVDFISTNMSSLSGDFRVKTGTSAGINSMIINGNLDVGISARLITSAGNVSAGAGGNIEVKGNINNQGTITSNGGPGTINNFLITGNTPQTFSNNVMTGIFAGINLLFTMANPAGLTLNTPLTLPWNADFIDGKIFTTATNILTMVDNAAYTSASSSSFVEGPMNKIGDDDFLFPVGAGSIYAPIGISAGSGSTISDLFTAEYKRINPQSIHGSAVQSGLNHVSYVEYWKLGQSIGTASKKVFLKVNTTSFCQVLANTFISRWNGSLWTNEASAISGFVSVPPFETGTLTSTAAFSNFGDFTLSTDLVFAANPLPINLISFDAIKSNSGSALLKWELAACCSDAARFEVEKSTGNRAFTSFGRLPGSLTNRFYDIYDNHLAKGITYYRLKMIDDDGKITYSKIVVIINDEVGLLITTLWPNPVQQNAALAVNVARAGKVYLVIADLSGKTIKQWYTNATKGNNNITITTDGLPSGVYHVIISDDNNKAVYHFVKQ